VYYGKSSSKTSSEEGSSKEAGSKSSSETSSKEGSSEEAGGKEAGRETSSEEGNSKEAGSEKAGGEKASSKEDQVTCSSNSWQCGVMPRFNSNWNEGPGIALCRSIMVRRFHEEKGSTWSLPFVDLSSPFKSLNNLDSRSAHPVRFIACRWRASIDQAVCGH
jgi:hypothetical protein